MTASPIFVIKCAGVAILVDHEDFEDLERVLPYAKVKLQSNGEPLIKLACWRRWRRLDVALTRTKCGRRNGEMYDMRRENLVPAERCVLRRYTA